MVLVDTAIVGRLGTVELAALAAGSMVLVTVVGLCIFLAYGTTATAARHLGAGNRSRAIEVGLSGVWLAVGLGTVLALVVGLASAHLVAGLSSSDHVADLASTYLRGAAASIPATLIVFAATGALRGLRDLTSPLMAMVGATALNAPLTWWLVHGLDLGMIGAASGLVIAQWVAALWLVARLLGHRDASVSWQPRPHEILLAARSAVPLFIRTVTLRASLLAATFVAAHMGDTSLAAHQVVTAVVTFLAFALDALAIAAQTLIGNSLGAGNREQTRAITGTTMRGSAIVGLTLGILVALSSPLVARAFTTSSEVVNAVIPALIVAAAIQPISGIVFALDGILIGAGDARYLAVAGLVTLVIYLPAALAVGAVGASFVWLWVAYGWFQIARLATLWWRERHDDWLVIGANIP